MSLSAKTVRLIAWVLVVFLVVVAVAVWLLDLITQQQVFGLLISAGFLAFGMLVYLYYKDTPQELSRRWLGSGFAALALLVVLAAVMFAAITPSPTPNFNVTLYGGEVSTSVLGFGNSSTTLTSPGPTLTFKVGDVVHLTFMNSGQVPHNWAIVMSNASSAEVLFNAQVGAGNNPILSGQSGSVVFTVTQAGNFFYICQVPGHLQLGMWGSVVVNP